MDEFDWVVTDSQLRLADCGHTLAVRTRRSHFSVPMGRDHLGYDG